MLCLDAYSCVRGICVEVNLSGTTSRICQCDVGWENDNSLFHLDNCGIPHYTLLAFFIVYGILIGIPLLGFFVRATQRAKGGLRRTGILLCIACINFSLFTFSLFLENGMFEVTSILLGINNATMVYVGENVLMLALRPVIAYNRHDLDTKTKLRLRRVLWLLRGVIIVACLIYAGLSRTQYFNFCILSHFFS